MIPKVIHYCWFGGKKIPKEYQYYISSWKRKCPDYRIVEWNESNFDLNLCSYIKEAYECQKWAFVSDFARFWILYNEGGVYLDTDVELVKGLDKLIDKGPFMGQEAGTRGVAPGLGLGVEKGNPLYKRIIDYYMKQRFVNKDGTINTYTVVQRVTDIMKEYGYTPSDRIQKIEGIYIYPPEYFCPYNAVTAEMNITPKTISIHHYAASWFPKTVRIKNVIKKKIGAGFTKKMIRLKNGRKR